MFIVPYLIKYLPEILVVLALLGLVAYVDIIRHENRVMSAAIETDKNIINQLTDNNKKLQDTITDENKSIDELKKVSDIHLQQAQVALQIAQKTANLHNNKANRIVSAVPDNKTNLCQSSDDLINQTLGLTK